MFANVLTGVQRIVKNEEEGGDDSSQGPSAAGRPRGKSLVELVDDAVQKAKAKP